MNRSTTSKERVMAAANRRLSDKIPVTFDAEKEVYAALWNHFGVQTKKELFDILGVDTWMLLPGNFACSKTEEHKSVKTSLWGYQTRVTEYAGGTYEEIVHNPLAGKDEIADIWAHPWPSADILDFSAFPAEAEAHGDRAIIGAFAWGAFHIATAVRGMESLLVDFVLRPDYADHLIGAISDITLEMLERMLNSHATGVDIVYMADDYCSQSGPLFNPNLFGRFVSPYLSKAVEMTHKHHKKFLLHVCGAVRPLLPEIIDLGVDMLEPIQTSAVGMDAIGLKRDFGKDICFYGGMDLQKTLCRGTSRQVADEVRMLVDVLGEGGGYVLGPGHTYIQPDAPLENILAMYETAASVSYLPVRG